MAADDAELSRAWESDPAAFEQVFDLYYDLVWRYLARVGGRECAEDLAGEVFQVGFARRASFDPSLGSVPSWLYGIARNLARSRSRSERRKWRAVERVSASMATTVSPIDDATDAMVQREQLVAVRDALARMSPTDREVITLFASERLSYEEIADVLQVEVGTVRSRLARARGRLRELLAASGQEPDDG